MYFRSGTDSTFKCCSVEVVVASVKVSVPCNVIEVKIQWLIEHGWFEETGNSNLSMYHENASLSQWKLTIEFFPVSTSANIVDICLCVNIMLS